MKAIGDIVPRAPRSSMTAQPSAAPVPALHPTAPAQVVGGVRLPKPTPALERAMVEFTNPHPDTGPNLALVTDPVRDEAGRQLRFVEALLAAGATAEAWRKFLLPLVTAVAKKPESREEFAEKVRAIAFALNHVASVVLTEDEQRRALRTFRFWPTPSELDGFFEPGMIALRRHARALQSVANATPPPAEAPIPAAEREAVRRQMDALAGELHARAAEERVAGGRPKPCYLTGEPLAAWREKQHAQVAKLSGCK